MPHLGFYDGSLHQIEMEVDEAERYFPWEMLLYDLFSSNFHLLLYQGHGYSTCPFGASSAVPETPTRGFCRGPLEAGYTLRRLNVAFERDRVTRSWNLFFRHPPPQRNLLPCPIVEADRIPIYLWLDLKYDDHTDLEPETEILHAETVLHGSNQFGAIKEAWLMVRSSVLDLASLSQAKLAITVSGKRRGW